MDADVGTTRTEPVVIHHTNGQLNRLLLEVDDQCLTVKLALVVGVHFDSLRTINSLVNYTILAELIVELRETCIEWKIGDVHSAVLLYLGLLAVGLSGHVKKLAELS